MRLAFLLPSLLALLTTPLALAESKLSSSLHIDVEISASFGVGADAPLAEVCAKVLTEPRFKEAFYSKSKIGPFEITKTVDPKRQQSTIEISQPLKSSFKWGGTEYVVPDMDLKLIDSTDMHELMTEVYGAVYANHTDFSQPAKIELIGKGGYRQVVRSPFNPQKVLKLSTGTTVKSKDLDLLSLALDHMRATFVPRVLADHFKAAGIEVAIPEAPLQHPGATKGAAAALEQPEVKGGKMLREFLPLLYRRYGDKYPVGKFPHLETQLRALNMNRNLGLFNVPPATRQLVETAAPHYALKVEIPASASQGELNPLEKLDRALTDVSTHFIPIDRAFLTAPRLVFDEAGLPMLKRNEKGELRPVTQHSMYGVDLNLRNIMVTPIRRQDNGKIVDYQLTVIDN